MDYSINTTRFAQFMALTSSSLKDIARLKSMKMENYGLSAVHTDCIWHLYHAENHELTQRALQDLIQVDRAQISRVLRELTDAGYVVQSDAGGTYKRPYRLTDIGMQAASEISDLIIEINNFVSRDIPPKELAIFYKTLRTIAVNLNTAVQNYNENFTD